MTVTLAIYFDWYFVLRFLIAWLVLARVWELVAMVLIRLAMEAEEGESDKKFDTFGVDYYAGDRAAEVAFPQTAMMVTHLMGRLLLPWFVAVIIYVTR